MGLQENGKYESIGGTTVHMLGILEHEDMLYKYRHELATILKIQGKSYEEVSELLRNEKVVYGLTDDMIFPNGDRHSTTGKCLGGNTGGVMGRGESLKKRLAQFDIPVEG